MRALGPGSVSSVLQVILLVVYVVLWIVVAVLALATLAALLLSFNPALLGDAFRVSFGDDQPLSMAAIVGGPAFGVLFLGIVLVIINRLRRVFATLTGGDPFHPDNVQRLRIIGLMLGALELSRYVFAAASLWLLPTAEHDSHDFSLTAWFSVLVVFVLAEVFREGARLRQDAELTI